MPSQSFCTHPRGKGSRRCYLVTMSERRANTRHPVSALVRVSADTRATLEPAWAHDLSEGGMSMHWDGAPGVDVDDELTIELPIGGTSSAIRTRARVIQANELGVVRVQFMDESAAFREIIGDTARNLVERRLAAQGAAA